MNLGEIGNLVCSSIPEDYQLIIEMEKGCAEFKLIDIEGEDIDISDITDATETNMDEKLSAILRYAINLEENQ